MALQLRVIWADICQVRSSRLRRSRVRARVCMGTRAFSHALVTAMLVSLAVAPAADAAPDSPTLQFANNTNASSGIANPSAASTGLTVAAPHLSWRNNATGAVDRQRVQVFTTPLDSSVVSLWRFNTATGM